MTRHYPGITMGILGAVAIPIVVIFYQACEGQVGLCAGVDCPLIPGCKDNPITCDPDHICVEQVCDGIAWICGVKDQKIYSWSRKSAPCDDLDSCTVEDICVEGRCVGGAKKCTSPPANQCQDASTLRAYNVKGTCKAGQCEYAFKDYQCPKGCQDGLCIGEPCLGIKCDNPGPCQENGRCVAGECAYDAKDEGASCDPQDACISEAKCDANHKCVGKTIDCQKPHTLGGTCVAGSCQGYQCEAGYADCNQSWADGCEEKVTSTMNCGKCGNACPSAPNATTECQNDKCVLKCKSPYEDCDGVFNNGCEIPVGVANTCSVQGLLPFDGSTPPCGTAYCGSSTKSFSTNFGTWFCTYCEHCYMFSNGGSWCLKAEGVFSSDRCTDCCNPNNPSFPPVCPQ